MSHFLYLRFYLRVAQTTFPGVVNESGPQFTGLTEIEQCLKANAAFSYSRISACADHICYQGLHNKRLFMTATL